MSDSERDGPGEGASSGERDPAPEFSGSERLPDDADREAIDREFNRIVAGWDDDVDNGWDIVRQFLSREEADKINGDPDTKLTAEGPDVGAHQRPPGDDGSSGPRHRVLREPAEPHPPIRPEIWRGPTMPLDPDIDLDSGRAGDAGTDAVDGAPGAEDLEARYVPPEPPPLGGDLISRLSWAAVLGGPLFLVFAVLFWRELPQLLMLAALAAFVGGFIALVARMPRERPADDEDDGAVV